MGAGGGLRCLRVRLVVELYYTFIRCGRGGEGRGARGRRGWGRVQESWTSGAKELRYLFFWVFA